MDPQLYSALSLLAIGMLTVFIVLALVVFTGKMLITLTNRWSNEDQGSNDDNRSVHEQHLVAITAAVEVITKGKGHITNIS